MKPRYLSASERDDVIHLPLNASFKLSLLGEIVSLYNNHFIKLTKPSWYGSQLYRAIFCPMSRINMFVFHAVAIAVFIYPFSVSIRIIRVFQPPPLRRNDGMLRF